MSGVANDPITAATLANKSLAIRWLLLVPVFRLGVKLV
jgi:hypothetical protein